MKKTLLLALLLSLQGCKDAEPASYTIHNGKGGAILLNVITGQTWKQDKCGISQDPVTKGIYDKRTAQQQNNLKFMEGLYSLTRELCWVEMIGGPDKAAKTASENEN